MTDDLLDALLQPARKRGKGRTEYIDAPEVESIAQEVISHFGLVDAEIARIKYLLKVSTGSKTPFRSKITKAGSQWKHCTGYDFIITVHEDFWKDSSPEAKRATLFHELSHIDREETQKGTKWFIRRHDVESFLEEPKFFGPWNDSLKSFHGELNVFEKQKELDGGGKDLEGAVASDEDTESTGFGGKDPESVDFGGEDTESADFGGEDFGEE